MDIAQTVNLLPSGWVGSIPTTATTFIGVLHNGSASVFETEGVGSIPTTPSIFKCRVNIESDVLVL